MITSDRLRRRKQKKGPISQHENNGWEAGAEWVGSSEGVCAIGPGGKGTAWLVQPRQVRNCFESTTYTVSLAISQPSIWMSQTLIWKRIEDVVEGVVEDMVAPFRKYT